MEEKRLNTLNIIKKLRDLLPTLSETEAEAARYQIEQLKKENPFLSSKIKTPNNVMECWETRDINRAKILKSRLEKEKNLLEGYNIILQENTTDLLLERVHRSQKIVYFIEREITQIKRFLEDSCVKNSAYNPEIIFSSKKAEKEVISKRSGKIHLSIVGILNENPLYTNIAIEIYTDGTYIGQIEAEKIQDSKSITIQFKDTYWLEFLIKSEDGVVAGLVFFPIEDVLDAQDAGEKKFYYTIVDHSALEISFGNCVFEKFGIQRSTTEIMTKEAFGHLLRKVEQILLYRCGVCGKGEDKNNEAIFYRCDWCKFTCHACCTNLIFFECTEFKKRKEAEKEKRELEIKMEELKKERLNIIIAGIDIREKPKDSDEMAGRVEKTSSSVAKIQCDEDSTSGNSSSEEDHSSKSVKRYNVDHTLTQEKILGVTWCCHCGDRIGMLSAALECTVCKNTYHLDCRSMIFKSCGINIDLLKGLVTYMPKKKHIKKSEISLSEFKFIYLLSSGEDGKIYLCSWRDRMVVLKAIQKKHIVNINHEELVDRERTGLEIAKTSENPFLVTMEGCFQTKTHVFFILEFLEGGDLYFHLYNRNMTQDEIKMILAGIVLGIEGLHSENIIHRGIRLENILFGKNGYVKISNMSICSIGANNGIARTFCGSFPVIAPEVMDEHYTKSVDWWGFGILAYQLMLKESPFPAGSIKQMKNSIKNDPPSDISRIKEPAKSFILGLLEKNPEKRLGTKSVKEIKDHPYFDNLDWDKMMKQELPVEWKPSDKEELCRNFDPEILVSNPTLSPSEEIDSSYNVYFQNF